MHAPRALALMCAMPSYACTQAWTGCVYLQVGVQNGVAKKVFPGRIAFYSCNQQAGRILPGPELAMGGSLILSMIEY